MPRNSILCKTSRYSNASKCLGVFLDQSASTTLYTGVSTNLSTRLWEHKSKQNKGSFSARYNVYKLVYIEDFETIVEAIKREKYLKGKSRAFKEALINKTNPNWNDLQSTFESAFK